MQAEFIEFIVFFNKSLMPASSIDSTSTGSLAHFSLYSFSQFVLLAHLTEQPKTFVVFTATSVLFTKASMALRASVLLGVLVGFSVSSILPL